jgi:homoserine O-succinyltransferase/O-acetyltransferase
MNVLSHSRRSTALGRSVSGGAQICVGLINNMGDQALKVTERQFGALVSEAAREINVRFRVFALGKTTRSSRALEYISAHYEPASAAMDGDLDALIITGAQPQADRLSDEPYWEELVQLIEWAKTNTASTILSCLAAHAAVLHLDGIERRPLPEKCAGVFAFEAQRAHPFIGEQGRVRLTPHSRYNGLLQSDLEQAGYAVLTSSPRHGVDSFTKRFGSQFVFLQGHPEYDANSLAREYRRDVDLYLRGETDRIPARPANYFGPEAEAELKAMDCQTRERHSGDQVRDLSIIEALAPAEPLWREAAVSFFRSWIEMVAMEIDPALNIGLNIGKQAYFPEKVPHADPHAAVVGEQATRLASESWLRASTA